ncbi:MAG TPA: diguanylate cyclase response regulator [Elusimicrobia bacterium]|nr:diguanylate cyclase response regulator [Elusimicrobiota bacterium]
MLAKKVLVVDDDPNVGLLISAVLKKYNYAVTTLYHGEEVLSFLRDNKPDLILLDLRMPGIDGYALCKRIREAPETRDIPVVILSGVAEMDAKVNTIELGADDFITKPFDVRELRARVNRILKRKSADTALNPLTRLPGSPAIEEEVMRRVADEEPFAFCYVDADNFKAYNDVYGYAKGDEVIKRIAALLAEKAREAAGDDYFVGHVGGDDFVLVTGQDAAEPAAKAITEEFDRVIPEFYNEADRKRGFITTMDRKNKTRDFPIMSLTVAIVAPKTQQKHYAKIVECAAELKHYAKDLGTRHGSIYVRDRRL